MNAVPDDTKITSAKLNLYVPARLVAEIREMAQAADRPVSREVRRALEDHVERHRVKDSAA
jgi:hypothetical protein